MFFFFFNVLCLVVVIHIMYVLEYLFIETNGVEFLRALNSDLYFDISVPVLVSVLLYMRAHTHTHTYTHTHTHTLEC